MAHCPAEGVKVYCVVAVLFIAGDQLPGMVGEFVLEEGKVNVLPLQIAGI